MEVIKEQVSKIFSNQESELLLTTDDYCPYCGGKRATIQFIPGINRSCKLPIACPCKSKEFQQKRQMNDVEETNRKLDKFRKYSMMDEQFVNCTFDNWDHSKTKERYFNLGVNYINRINEMKQKQQGMLFWGPPGISKSHLSYCIANEAIKMSIPTIAISVEGIANKIKSTYNNDSKEEEAQILNNLFGASLIILDDLGTEIENEWNKKIVGSVIDGIWRAKRLLIVTTNLTPEQLKKRYSSKESVDRIYDRLYEMCAFVQMTGQSIRQQIGAEKEKNIVMLFSEADR